ncbi:MAG: aldehyde dehydrogenase family protein [Kiloniellales bacterium]
MSQQAVKSETPVSEGEAARAPVAGLVAKGRAAMASLSGADQDRVDDAVRALAWSLYKPENARALAEMAVADTGLGNVPDKIIKNQRKTFGCLRDLLRVRSVGVIEEDKALGLTIYAKPVGVVAAVTPSTNPAATPINKAMMAIKGRNAIILAPSPAGWPTTARTAELARAELEKAGHDPDLLQILPQPVTREATKALMAAADLIVCTGSQNNVRAAYSSGTPAIGVGVGNVSVIIDESADLTDAAEKICASKIFDNATSCSSENSVIILDEVYAPAIQALEAAGGYLATTRECDRIAAALWQNGKLSRDLLAKDAAVLAAHCGLPEATHNARFFMVEESSAGPDHPFSGEKLSLVLAVYRARDFADAKRIFRAIMAYQGAGHSVGLHTGDPERARELAEELDVVRVLVNQAHTFGNGGSFDNGLNFTLSMGCGTWGGNSISENLNWRHFVNLTHLVTTIPEDRPSEQELFGAYWTKYGQ